MRHVNGDERNAGLEILRRNRRGNRLVDLELDDQIDLFLDQQLGVPKRRARVALVVEHHQLDVLGRGGEHEPVLHGLLERAVVPERRVADPVALATVDIGASSR